MIGTKQSIWILDWLPYDLWEIWYHEHFSLSRNKIIVFYVQVWLGSWIRDEEGLWDLYWITWSDDSQREDVRSGTSCGLGLTSLPVVLRVKLKWSVSPLGWLVWGVPFLGRSLGTWPYAPELSMWCYKQTQNSPGPDESLSTRGHTSLPRLASFCPEATWFCWWRTTSCSTGSLALPFIDSVTLGKFLAPLNFGFHIGFLTEN